jgi:hypothetical protein
MSNKFFLSFNLGDLDRISDSYAVARRAAEARMAAWCTDRLGPQGFPLWQFADGILHMFASSTGIDDPLIIHKGIYIFRDDDKVAFRLAFGI